MSATSLFLFVVSRRGYSQPFFYSFSGWHQIVCRARVSGAGVCVVRAVTFLLSRAVVVS